MLSRPTLIGRNHLATALATCLVFGGGAVHAESASHYRLKISDQGFTPAKVTIPAGKKVALEVHNARKLPSEFESSQLNREKLVPAGSTLKVWIGPLSPGRYAFFDDFNPGKKGEVIVKQNPQAPTHAQ